MAQGATTRSCVHWCRVARGYTDRQRRSGWRGARARPSLCPESYVRVLRSRAGRYRSFFVKPARALVASVPSILVRMTRRVVRSTSVPTADPLRVPLIQSPSPCRHGAGGHLGGTLRDRRHSGNLAAAVCSSRPRPTRFACLPQRGHSSPRRVLRGHP
jgi:hypothetical protein